MPNVSDVMTTDVHVVQPQESLRQAATLMEELDLDALPVCDGPRLLGMLTDRDITIHGVAQGLDPNSACVSDVMSENGEYCTADQDTEEVSARWAAGRSGGCPSSMPKGTLPASSRSAT